MVNDVDDQGVLSGRWQPPYDDGIAPWEWSGSAKILDKYMEGNGVPVKYGQCWVFSALTVTSKFF
jgi:transglutaminase 1